MGKIVTAIVVVVILALAGLGYYIYGHPAGEERNEQVTVNTENKPGFVIATSTPITPTLTATTSQTATVPNIPNAGEAKPAVKPKPTQTATVYNAAPRRAGYHSSAYGLTIPGNYTVSVTRNQYAGVWNTATLNFFQGGVLAFTINVFSKEQWNDIRIQETINADRGNTAGTYFGEGSYLGENYTWIFSAIPGSYGLPAGITFY